MRKNWKRVLAAVLAACMIFCDSSLVYAAESQPIVEASETETEVEATEIGDETILPEATEEEVITEEPAEEADEAESVEETEEVLAEEETVVEEPTEETDLEEFLPEEEKEVVEIEPVTEVISVEQMNTDSYDELVLGKENGTITVAAGEQKVEYSQTFDYTATEDGGHFIYTDGDYYFFISSALAYKEDGITLSTTSPEVCYDFDVDAKDATDRVEGRVLKKGTKYRITIKGSVDAGTTASFYIGKYENEPTQLVSGTTVTVPANSKVVYKVCEDTTQTGIVEYTYSGDFYGTAELYASGLKKLSHHNNFTSELKGQIPFVALAGCEYYIAIVTGNQEETISWNRVVSETLELGSTEDLATSETLEYKFFEFVPDTTVDYVLSDPYRHCLSGALTNNGDFTSCDQDYYDSKGNCWRRYKNIEDVEKIYIITYVNASSPWTLEFKERDINEINPVLTLGTEVTIPGAGNEYEYDSWFKFIPSMDSNYYLRSENLTVEEIGILNSETQEYDEVELDYFYTQNDPFETVEDVAKCYKMERNKTYGVRIKGTIPTDSATFTWSFINDDSKPQTLTSGKTGYLNYGISIYEIQEAETNLVKLTLTDYGYGDMAFYGDEFKGQYKETSQAKEQVIAAIGGSSIYAAMGDSNSFKYSYNVLEPQTLYGGDEISTNPTVTTDYYYEFEPNDNSVYELFVQAGEEEIIQVGTDGKYKSYGEKVFDDQNNEWIRFEKISDVEKIYIIIEVAAGSEGKIVLKEISQENTTVDGETITALKVDQLVSVAGGDSGKTFSKWYDFVPEKDGYYYVESNVFHDYEYATYSADSDKTTKIDNLPVRCILNNDGTYYYDKVTVSHFFEAGTHYKVYVRGAVSANSFGTFTFRECTESELVVEIKEFPTLGMLQEGENVLYKVSASENELINIRVDGENELYIYGSNYVGLEDTSDNTADKQYCNRVMHIEKEGTYYFLVPDPINYTEIEFTKVEAKEIKAGDSFKHNITEGCQFVCYEFVPDSNTEYELYMGTENIAASIVEKEGCSYNEKWESTVDSDGNKWFTIPKSDSVERIYLMALVEAGTERTITLKAKDPYNITLNTFDGSINVPAGETVTVTYEGPHLGDYFITRGGVNFKSTYVGPGLKAPVVYTWLGTGQFYTYSFADNYDVNTTDTAKFTFTLENTTDYEQSISIGNSLESYTWDSNLDEDGNLSWSADMETEKRDFYASYYKFTANETTVYSHSEIAWVMRVQDANGNNEAIRWDKYELEDGKIILNAGETYIFKFISNKSDDDADWYSIPAIYEETYSTTSASSLFYDGEDDYISVYHFTPMLSGRYSNETKDKIVTVWEQNVGNGTWTKVSKLADSATGYADYELSAEKEYLVVFDESTLFALKSNVTVLDYDYYDTFVNTATGGSISIDTNGKVTITPKSKGAKLVAKICSILGIADYSDEDTLDELKDGNAYWKGFVPKKLYKLVDKQLVENVEGIVEDGDVVVVKYEPEVVWVHSMTVTADKTVMNIDDESQIHVAAKAATTKYPLDNPIFTYVSSNPEIVSVDKNGKMTALAAGKVKITVMADVAARFEEGCSNKILKKDIWVTVSQRFNINYENLFDANGESIGLLNESNPTEYNTLETTDLGVPTAVEGYDFVGWYSDEAQTKKITSIAKGSTGDKTIYAKWELHDYNINYELGDGKFATDANQPTTFTMDKETVLVDPILQGYALEYWYWLKKEESGELYEEELPYNIVKENSEDPESPETKIWYIPENVKEDVQIFAKWKFDTEFSLTINGEKDEDGNVTITHPYNSATGEWNLLDSSFVVQSDTEGIVPEYYNDGVLSVSATLMKYNEDSSMFELISSWDSDYDRYEEYEFYRVTDLMADDIEAPGKYRLEVNYTHPGQDRQYLEQEFTVNYAKREYPVNKEVSWSALSNVDRNRTYSMIASEIANKMQPNESVFREDKGEEKLDFDEDLVNVIFKDSRNRVVKNTAKVTSGTYTVVLEFAENDRFLTEATGTVNISYGTIASAGVQYLSAETLEGKDSKGRIPGPTIAYEIPELDEDGNPVLDDRGEPSVINTTPYVNGVQIDPIVKVPWSTEAIPVAALEASLEANGYHGYTVSVGVTDASRKEFLSFSEVTSAITEEVVAYIVTGKAAGKANIVFETTITDSEGNEVAVIPTTIKNFTVVNGGVDAVETITFDLYKSEEIIEENLFAPKETDVMGVKTYLVEKDDEARIYWLDVKARNYEGNAPENVKLTWKSSNNKLAAVKTAKDGTVTLTIPKNAQGVVDVTVTANDVTKKSQSMKFVIADTSMRLDTTSLTMNSKFAGDSAIAYLYPNVLSSEIEGVDKESLFGNTITVEGNGYDRIAIYKKVGKSDYEKSEIFNSFYDLERGELIITFKYGNYPVKAATHNVYVGILHEEDIKENPDNPVPSERYALKIKDTCALPKAPSLKVAKNYEVVYKEGWAELTVTLKSRAAHMQDENGNYLYDDEGNWRPAIQTTDKTKFEVVSWEDLSYGNGTTWKLKLRANDESVLPAANQKKKVTNVEFVIGYDGYRQDVDALAKTKANITAVRTIPTLPVYGEDAYAPVYYTDADYRYVDVVIPVPKELIEGMTNEERTDLTNNADSSGAILNLEEDKELEIVLADAKPGNPNKFEVYEAEIRNYYFEVPGKKDSVEVEHAIAATVIINSSQKKNVNLQFNVRSTALEDGVTITTKALTIKPRTIKSETISLFDWNTGKTIKSLNFNSNYAGKESIEIEVMEPATLSSLSEMNGFEYDSRILVEAADKNTQKMLQNDELLVEVDEYGDVFKVTSTNDSFKYKSAKLKITMVANENTGNPLKTKSTTLTLNFKKALTPKIAINNAKMIRGLNVHGKGYEHAEYWGAWVETKVKYTNMPVGAEVIDIRFADQADYTKYFDPYGSIEYESLPDYLYIEARPDAKLSLGKDAIGLIYDVRTATGEVISIPVTLNLTISDSFSLKADTKSINLYNTAVGKEYGKYVRFYDTKRHAVEVLEIINAEELKKAGINFDLTAETEEDMIKEQDIEYFGDDAVKFYVDDSLKRGIEKTYTVKAKVAVVDSAVKKHGDWTTTTATEKTLTFKIVLKK